MLVPGKAWTGAHSWSQNWYGTPNAQVMLGVVATCRAAIDDLLRHLEANADVWAGWTWWAAGPWWGDYMFALEPSNGADRPLMSALTPHLP